MEHIFERIANIESQSGGAFRVTLKGGASFCCGFDSRVEVGTKVLIDLSVSDRTPLWVVFIESAAGVSYVGEAAVSIAARTFVAPAGKPVSARASANEPTGVRRWFA